MKFKQLNLLLMKGGSLEFSKETKKANISKQTREGEETMNLSNNGISKSSLLRKKQPSLYYDHIPMAKSVPQWNHSATTLRYSPSYHRFSRSQRFSKPKSSDRNAQQLNIPSTLSRRFSSIGFGEKTKIPDVLGNGIGTATKLCPFYNIDDWQKRSNSSLNLRVGKTFGLGWKHYESSRVDHRNTVHCSYQVKANPGPNHYKLNPQKKVAIKMHERLPMFTTLSGKNRLTEPHPQSYQIREQLQQNNKRSTSLGMGQKVDFTKLRQKTPGPIYSLNSFCDKYVHLKMKLGQK